MAVLLMSQTGAPGLGSAANSPTVLGMGSALGLAMPVPCIAAAQCPVPPPELALTSLRCPGCVPLPALQDCGEMVGGTPGWQMLLSLSMMQKK